jgi:hypothetical protein
MNVKLIAPIVTLESAFVLAPTSYGGSHLEARVEANKFVITRPDGKQYKPTITRRERDQAATR